VTWIALAGVKGGIFDSAQRQAAPAAVRPLPRCPFGRLNKSALAEMLNRVVQRRVVLGQTGGKIDGRGKHETLRVKQG